MLLTRTGIYMKKICKIIKNWSFLCRFSWGISRGIFFTEGLQLILNTIEPFIILVFPKFIIDELTGEKQWDRVLYYILVFMGVQALLQGFRLCLQPFVNGMINHTDVRNGMHYARHFLNIDYSRLEDGKLRDFQQEIKGNVHAYTIVVEGIMETITDLIRLAGYSYLILTMHPLVLAVVFGVAALQASGWLSDKFLELLDAHKKLYTKFQNRQLSVKILEMCVGFIQMAILYGYGTYEALAKEKSVIYISHRMSSTRLTDRIAVFDKGRIVEYGKHEELMNHTDGVYKAMFQMQAQYYI